MNDDQLTPPAPLPPHVLEGRSYRPNKGRLDVTLVERAGRTKTEDYRSPVSSITTRQIGCLFGLSWVATFILMLMMAPIYLFSVVCFDYCNPISSVRFDLPLLILTFWLLVAALGASAVGIYQYQLMRHSAGTLVAGILSYAISGFNSATVVAGAISNSLNLLPWNVAFYGWLLLLVLTLAGIIRLGKERST